MLLRCTSQCVRVPSLTVFLCEGWKFAIYHMTCYGKSGSHTVCWEMLFSRSSLPTALRLADPSVSPCRKALQPPAEAEWIHNVKCLFWYRRWEKRGWTVPALETPPCRCRTGKVLWNASSWFNQSRRKRWGKVKLWRCWFAAEWTEETREQGGGGIAVHM